MIAKSKVNSLAFQGHWEVLLPLLKEYPSLVNSSSASQGYTPLHQAAWHGASLSVIGTLLNIGADCRLRTANKRQSPLDIACEKHPKRYDLAYVFAERQLTIAQLMRKIIFTESDLFDSYDGNQVLADRLIVSFGAEPCPERPDELIRRMENAFRALTGVSSSSCCEIQCEHFDGFGLKADTRFWTSKFFPLMILYASRAYTTPIQKEWAVVSDLFSPAPPTWSGRGDLFLWIEMRQALCHVQIPDNLADLAEIIKSAFQALTGKTPRKDDHFFVKRLARGGMSSGWVSSLFWAEEFVALIELRASWLIAMCISTQESPKRITK